MRRTTRAAGDLGLLLLAAVVVAGAFVLLVDGPGSLDRSRPTPAPPAAVKVVAITDELGVAGPGVPSALAGAATELMLDLEVISAKGTGFTTAPVGSPNFAGLITRDLAEDDYDLVILQGGAMDATARLGTLGAAALGAIDRIRTRVPERARIVLIGPVSGAELEGVRATLRTVAARKRVAFLDPVGAVWLDPPATSGTLSGTQQRQLSQRLVAELRSLGLDRL